MLLQNTLTIYAIQQVKRLRALTRIKRFLSQEQTKSLSQAYIMSTFKYCPLVRVFCGKTENKSINKIQNCYLQSICDMEDAISENLLRRGKLRTIHEDTLHKLLDEIYKSVH